jgi:hypothetical protein
MRDVSSYNRSYANPKNDTQAPITETSVWESLIYVPFTIGLFWLSLLSSTVSTDVHYRGDRYER